jgi:hypothetical protein
MLEPAVMKKKSRTTFASGHSVRRVSPERKVFRRWVKLQDVEDLPIPRSQQSTTLSRSVSFGIQRSFQGKNRGQVWTHNPLRGSAYPSFAIPLFVYDRIKRKHIKARVSIHKTFYHHIKGEPI